MKYKAFTLVEIMIVVAIIALLAMLAIPNMLRNRLNANQSVAIATLKTISTACESFSAGNDDGDYPNSEDQLVAPVSGPPYLNQSYCGKSTKGYIYTCTFAAAGYTVIAAPLRQGVTGEKTFTVTTGAVFNFS